MGGAFSFARGAAARGNPAAAPFSFALGDAPAFLAEVALFLKVAAVNHRASYGYKVS